MAQISSQSEWRFCNKCFSIFWNGAAFKGVCAAGSGHDATGSWDFLLYADPTLPQLTVAPQPNQTGYDVSYQGTGFPNVLTLEVRVVGWSNNATIAVGVTSPDANGNISGGFSFNCTNPSPSPNAVVEVFDISNNIVVASAPALFRCTF
jgi:hypothetical protein